MSEHPTNSKEIITVSRRILVQITGSMKQFEEQGKQAATWSPINAKVGDVFGVHDIFETTPDQGTTSALNDDEWYKIMKPVFSTCCEALNY